MKTHNQCRSHENRASRGVSHYGREQGVALITALLLVTLATIIAVAAGSRMQLDLRRTTLMLHSDQALYYSRGLEAWALGQLKRDSEESDHDHPAENWGVPMPLEEVAGGTIEGQLWDLQGCFNINNLISEGQLQEEAVEALRRLLDLLDLSTGLADGISDWIDEDSEPRYPDGAEDDYYLLQQPAYRAANRPLAAISELRLISGVDSSAYEQLRHHLCVLPANTRLNINSASKLVLQAWLASLDETAVDALVAARNESPFTTREVLLNHPAVAGQLNQESAIDVKSEFFLLQGVSRVGESTIGLEALIQRAAGKEPTLLSRTLVREHSIDGPSESVREPLNKSERSRL